MERDRLFVYGTLRPGSGVPAAARLAREAELLGPARAPGRLFRVAHYPGLVAGSTTVRGAIYRLPDPPGMLPLLDAYEGPGFRREWRAAWTGDGRRVRAWLYAFIGPIDGLREIEWGDFLEGTASAPEQPEDQRQQRADDQHRGYR